MVSTRIYSLVVALDMIALLVPTTQALALPSESVPQLSNNNVRRLANETNTSGRRLERSLTSPSYNHHTEWQRTKHINPRQLTGIDLLNNQGFEIVSYANQLSEND